MFCSPNFSPLFLSFLIEFWYVVKAGFEMILSLLPRYITIHTQHNLHNSHSKPIRTMISFISRLKKVRAQGLRDLFILTQAKGCNKL